MNSIERVCLLGFGEVGQTLAADLTTADALDLAAFDIQFDRADSVPSLGAASLPAVRRGANAADAASECQLVVSAVTAAEDLNAIRSVVTELDHGALLLDLNSVSPNVKREAGAIVEFAGGRYIEAAVMAPIGPKRIGTQMLLGGPHAQAALPPLRALGFAGASVFSAEIGPASAAKMCRSVVVKGVEALLAESLLAARRYGVDDAVVDSLDNLLPGADWRELSRYMISRSLQHGVRRAEEMREVARTVADAGLEPLMSNASEARQAWAALFDHARDSDNLGDMLDAILAGMESVNEGPTVC